MGASQRPKDPDMDPEADDGGSVQPPDDPRSTESFTWLPRIKSISPFLDFKEESSLMPDCYSSSEVKVEADDVDSVQSPDDPRSTESFTWLPRIKSISPLVNFKEESSLMLVKKEEEKEEVATADVDSVQSAHYQLYIDCLQNLNSLPLNFKEGSSVILYIDCLQNLNSLPLNFKEGSSVMLEGPSIDPEADDGGLLLSAKDLLAIERFFRRRRNSISAPPDSKEGSSVMPEGPSIGPGLIHHHLPRPSDPPSCTSETSTVSGVSIKSDMSIDRLTDFLVNSTGSSVGQEADVRRPVQPPEPPRRDEVIQETNVGSGTEILLKHLPSGTSAGQPAVNTRLVLQREQQLQLREQEQLRERELQLQEREQLREWELREREQQLREREQQLQEREQQLQEREQLREWELREREQQLREREQQLRKQEQQLQERQQQLQELQEREQLRERKRKRKLPDSKSL